MAGNWLIRNIKEQLHISTVADDAAAMARKYGVGLEIAEFCTAFNMDQYYTETDRLVRAQMEGVSHFTFHAPFNELCSAAIDPLVQDVTRRRYQQAYDLSRQYGISRMIVHSGFIPNIYFPEWFVKCSIDFWKAFIADKPDAQIFIENVMDETPDVIVDLVKGIDDPRVKICLDIGHANAFHTKVDVPEWIDAMAPWLGHIHIHNNDGGWDIHNVLGEGTIPMAETLANILDRAPDVTFAIENMHCEPSMIWLVENGFLEG